MVQYLKEQFNQCAIRYIDDLMCLTEEEKNDLKIRATSHTIFCNNWKQLQDYIDGKKVEIIIYGKMKPDPEALDFGSW